MVTPPRRPMAIESHYGDLPALTPDELRADCIAFALGCCVQSPTLRRMIDAIDRTLGRMVPPEDLVADAWLAEVEPPDPYDFQFTTASYWEREFGVRLHLERRRPVRRVQWIPPLTDHQRGIRHALGL